MKIFYKTTLTLLLTLVTTYVIATPKTCAELTNTCWAQYNTDGSQLLLGFWSDGRVRFHGSLRGGTVTGSCREDQDGTVTLFYTNSDPGATQSIILTSAEPYFDIVSATVYPCEIGRSCNPIHPTGKLSQAPFSNCY